MLRVIFAPSLNGFARAFKSFTSYLSSANFIDRADYLSVAQLDTHRHLFDGVSAPRCYLLLLALARLNSDLVDESGGNHNARRPIEVEHQFSGPPVATPRDKNEFLKAIYGAGNSFALSHDFSERIRPARD